MSGRTRRRWGRVAVAATVAFAGVAALSPDDDRGVEAVGDLDLLGAGGEFHSLRPARIFDSRCGGGRTDFPACPAGAAKPTRPPGQSTAFDVRLAGRGGLPAFRDLDADGFDDRVLAVVVNIIVIGPSQGGHLRVFPAGAAEGTTSVANFDPGATVSNTAVVRPGIDGDLSIRFETGVAGAAHLAIDISGWFSTSAHPERGARLVPIPPIRAYDSREAVFGAATLRAGAQVEVPIRGAADYRRPSLAVVPNDPAVVGVVVNVTGVNGFPGSTATYISALPEPVAAGSRPATSTVNLAVGDTRANLAILRVGDDGAIRLFNFSGEIRLVVDVVGYLVAGQPAGSRAGRVVPLVAPLRVFDTRRPEFRDQPLGPGRAEDWSFRDFAGDVRIAGDPVGAQSGVLANLTATNLQRQYAWTPVSSHLTAYPTPAGAGGAPPGVSNLNIPEASNVANMAVLRYGGDADDRYQVRFYNFAGYVDYLLDVYAVVLAD